ALDALRQVWRRAAGGRVSLGQGRQVLLLRRGLPRRRRARAASRSAGVVRLDGEILQVGLARSRASVHELSIARATALRGSALAPSGWSPKCSAVRLSTSATLIWPVEGSALRCERYRELRGCFG